MPIITVSITKAPSSAVNVQASMVFSAQGGTIGRSPNNTWVLDDPERFISGVHARVACVNDSFHLTDLSSNGTFFNGSTDAIGRGRAVVLSDGDVFVLGDYEFKVAISASAAGAGVVDRHLHDIALDPKDPGPFADLNLGPARSVDPLLLIPERADESWGHELFDVVSTVPEKVYGADPLQLLGDERAGLFAESPEWRGVTSYSDGAGAINQACQFPGSIPEDWDDDLLDVALPETPVLQPDSNDVDAQRVRELEQRITELESLNSALELQLKQLQKRAAVSVKREVGGENSIALIQSLGLDKRGLSDEKMVTISGTAGEFIRATITGMMQALSYRNSIKNEFRMNVTTIQPVENNPLNFSANIEDAIENMFIKEGNAYKKPVDSIREGFQSIGEHQVAVLAGIRAGFNGGLERFNPELLEKRFNKYLKSGLIQVSKKARYWDSYRDYYGELVGDMDASFRELFGDDFVNAYEDQLQKLSLNRLGSIK